MARTVKNGQRKLKGNGEGAANLAGKSARDRVIQERKAQNSYFTFNRKVGNRFNITPQKNMYGTPGLMTMYFTPTFGFNNDAESEIQSAVNELYKYVRSYQTAQADYTAPDLMMYVLAAEQIFNWVAFLSRGFNTLQFSAYDNRYVARVLNIACGFDYDDLKSKRTQLADHINYIIQTMCDYALPKQCSFALRQEWMCSNVFMDEPNTTAQLYIPVPRTFLKLVEQVDESNVVTYRLEEIDNPQTSASDDVYFNKGIVHGSIVHTAPTASAPVGRHYTQINPIRLSFSDIENITAQLLSPFILMHMQDISGDIRHAFGDNNLREWSPLMIGADWSPVYDENALLQINNTTFVGHLDVNYTHLTENTTGELLISNPCLLGFDTNVASPYYGAGTKSPSNILKGDRILNTTVPDPTPDEKLLATRWTNAVTNGTAMMYPNTNHLRVDTAGTEIMEFGLIWVFDYANGQSLDSIIAYTEPLYYAERPGLLSDSNVTPTTTTTGYMAALVQAMNAWENKLGWLTAFEKHPIVAQTFSFTNVQNAAIYNGTDIAYHLDLANWTPITPDDLRHLTNVDLSMAFTIRV